MTRLKESIPLISALLIFIGYLNYKFYFDNFGIEIASYLTTTELIFSFLPLTVPLLLLAVFLSLMFLSIPLIFPRSEAQMESATFDTSQPMFHELVTFRNTWGQLVKHWKNPERNRDRIIWIICYCILAAVLLVVAIFLLVFPFILLGQSLIMNPQLPYLVFTFPSLMWLLLFYAMIRRNKNEVERGKYMIFFYWMIVCYSVMILYLRGAENANEVLAGKPTHSVRLVMDSTAVQTDSTFVYVGRTSNYIYFYDRKINEAKIIDANSVRSVSMREIISKH